MANIRLMRTRIQGQHSITLSQYVGKFGLTNYLVEYGEEENHYDDIDDALNRYNQCCLHAETCAGFHDKL